MFVVYSSMLFFSTVITPFQIFGLVLADSGLLMYTYLKLNTQKLVMHVSNKRKRLIKKWMLFILIGVLLVSFTSELNRNASSSLDIVQNFKASNKYEDRNRLICLSKIKKQIVEIYDPLIPKNKDVYITYVAQHHNYGDILIW